MTRAPERESKVDVRKKRARSMLVREGMDGDVGVEIRERGLMRWKETGKASGKRRIW